MEQGAEPGGDARGAPGGEGPAQGRVGALWRRLPRRVRRELAPLLGLLVLVVAGSGFLGLASRVAYGASPGLDARVLLALRDPEDPTRVRGPAWVASVARDVTALGSAPVLGIMLAAVAGFLVLRRLWAGLGVLAGAVCGAVLLALALKRFFARERPDVVAHLDMAHTHGFPSGHSMLAVVVYLTLGALLARIVRERALKAYFLAVAVGLAFLVGVSRLLVGVHYPSDVAAGWAAGLAWAALVWLVALSLLPEGGTRARTGTVGRVGAVGEGALGGGDEAAVAALAAAAPRGGAAARTEPGVRGEAGPGEEPAAGGSPQARVSR